jgi:serine/threonine-protein kinase
VQGWIGRVIDDRYHVVEKLGEGGMGTVFIAEHTKLQKRVALKVILPEFAGDGEMAARFAREAMASARLDHPHVASALDYGTLAEGGAYLVMQLARGHGLNKVLENEGAQPWPKACAIAAQVADALAEAHAEGIVHRDLKPENVLIEKRSDGSELVKVLDFGIARVQHEGAGQGEGAAPARALTRVGTVMGTPGYMAPEQAVGEAVDHHVDLYALGVMLWEMLVGRPLFSGQTLTEIMTEQLTNTPPPVRQVAPQNDLPEALEGLVAALLARSASERPHDAKEVRDSLRQLAFAAGTHPDARDVTGAYMTAAQGTGRFTTGMGTGYGPATGHAQPAATTAPAQTTRVTAPVATAHVPNTLQVRGRRVPIPLLIAALATPILLGGFAIAGWTALGSEEPQAGAQAQTQPAEPSMIERILSNPPKITKPSVPPKVQEHIDTMLQADSRRERKRAAEWLQDYEPAKKVPDYALVVADLEEARRCRAMRSALEEIRELGDERAKPAVQRMHDHPERGCGLLNLRDCYGCVRDDIAETLDSLEGKGNAPK